MHAIRVKHNIEMGHRLWALPGQCTHLHGHSWWCELTIHGKLDSRGILGGLDFHSVKKEFRAYLDGKFDHKLALDMNDPLIKGLESPHERYPGLVIVPAMATVENMAEWIGTWAYGTFGTKFEYHVTLWEAATNAALWSNVGEADK